MLTIVFTFYSGNQNHDAILTEINYTKWCVKCKPDKALYVHIFNFLDIYVLNVQYAQHMQIINLI